MYEQARLEEHKDVPVVVVLDKAVPAERKSRPKRMFIVAGSCLSALILAVMATFALVRLEFFRTDHADRYATLRRAIGRTPRD